MATLKLHRTIAVGVGNVQVGGGAPVVVQSMTMTDTADAARQAGVALQVNAFGSLVTPFFTSQPVRDLTSALTSDTARYAAFFRGMLARGVYPPPSQFEAWFLSGAHTERDVDATITAARAALRDT